MYTHPLTLFKTLLHLTLPLPIPKSPSLRSVNSVTQEVRDPMISQYCVIQSKPVQRWPCYSEEVTSVVKRFLSLLFSFEHKRMSTDGTKLLPVTKMRSLFLALGFAQALLEPTDMLKIVIEWRGFLYSSWSKICGGKKSIQ